MTEVTITDAGGESLSMLDFDGFKMSFYGQTTEHIRDVYKNLPDFKFRDNDIFLTSYPKAGKTFSVPKAFSKSIHLFYLPLHVQYSTVEFQWLEHLLNHENMFETG